MLRVLVGALGVWCVALVIAGYAAAGCQKRRVEQRIARAFEAKVGFGDADLSLLRGRFGGDDLTIAKDTPIGTLRVHVGRLEAELAPLGLALVDGGMRALRLSDVNLEATTLELLRATRRGGKPFAVDELELTNVRLVTMPTTLVPGLGKLELTIQHARAGPTVLRTPLSWVFSLRELVARVDVEGGVSVRVEYRGGVLRASGGVLGSTWVDVPFAIPVLDPAREMEQLAALGVDLAAKMTLRQAESILQQGWDAVTGALGK
jgi:hypothetical protein